MFGGIYNQTWWGRVKKDDYGIPYQEFGTPVYEELIIDMKGRADYIEAEACLKEKLDYLYEEK